MMDLSERLRAALVRWSPHRTTGIKAVHLGDSSIITPEFNADTLAIVEDSSPNFEAFADLVVEAVNSLPGLLDTIASLEARVKELEAGCEPMPAVTEDGWCEWVHPLPGYLMQCCDCGLIHEMEVAIVPRNSEWNNGALNEGEGENVAIFRMRRAPNETGAA